MIGRAARYLTVVAAVAVVAAGPFDTGPFPLGAFRGPAGCGLTVTPDTIDPADTSTVVTLTADPARFADTPISVTVTDAAGRTGTLSGGTAAPGGTETIAAADLASVAANTVAGPAPHTVTFTAPDPATGRTCATTITVDPATHPAAAATSTDTGLVSRLGNDPDETMMAVLLGGGTAAVAVLFRRRALRPRKPTPATSGT